MRVRLLWPENPIFQQSRELIETRLIQPRDPPAMRQHGPDGFTKAVEPLGPREQRACHESRTHRLGDLSLPQTSSSRGTLTLSSRVPIRASLGKAAA